MVKSTIKVIYFQALWFLLIFSSLKSYHNWILLTVFVSIYLDYVIFRYRVSALKYFLYMIGLMLIGFLIDQLFFYLGVLKWTPQMLHPPFLLGVWAMFIVYYENFFSKFSDQKFLGFLFASIGSPVAYFSGAKMSDLSFHYGFSFSSIVFSLIWGVFFILSIDFYDRFIRRTDPVS